MLIGVNGDETREKGKEVMAKEKMTWPSFWNGDNEAASVRPGTCAAGRRFTSSTPRE